MKRKPLIRLFTLIILLLTIGQSIAQDKYHIKVEIQNYNNDKLTLGYRLGDRTYIVGTEKKDAKGIFHFKGDSALQGGVYLIVTKPENRFFEFLIAGEDQQHLTITTNFEPANLTDELEIKGSPDNTLFFNYLQFMGKTRKLVSSATKELEQLKKTADSPANQEKITALEEKLKNYNKESMNYGNNLIKNHPNSFTATILGTSKPIDVPETITDKNQRFYYYKKHFWDYFNWSDDRLVRSIAIYNKMTQYLDKVSSSNPDSVMKSCDRIIGMAKQANNEEMYQYVVSTILNKYATTKKVCFEKVYVHVGEKYYCGSNALSWLDEDQRDKICKNVEELKPVICGVVAPKFRLKDVKSNNDISLQQVNAKYTVLYFWDTECKNCRAYSQSLVEFYNKWNNKGVEIIGIAGSKSNEIDKIRELVDDLKMKWMTLSGQTHELLMVRKHYNVQANPSIFLLNENKEIISKRIDASQLDELMEYYLKE